MLESGMINLFALYNAGSLFGSYHAYPGITRIVCNPCVLQIIWTVPATHAIYQRFGFPSVGAIN